MTHCIVMRSNSVNFLTLYSIIFFNVFFSKALFCRRHGALHTQLHTPNRGLTALSEVIGISCLWHDCMMCIFFSFFFGKAVSSAVWQWNHCICSG